MDIDGRAYNLSCKQVRSHKNLRMRQKKTHLLRFYIGKQVTVYLKTIDKILWKENVGIWYYTCVVPKIVVIYV
jgi:hypothetical protein